MIERAHKIRPFDLSAAAAQRESEAKLLRGHSGQQWRKNCTRLQATAAWTLDDN